VRLSVYNLVGKEISVIVNEEQTTGKHTAQWNAGDTPAGIYFVTLTIGSKSVTNKIVLNK
jgi:hypothetical protein